MKPLDDMLPEEKDPQFEELIILLRQANLNPMIVEPTRQAQILSRARARVMQTDPGASLLEDMPVPEMRGLTSLSSKSQARRATQQRGGRLVHLLTVLAAVLVVTVLIGSGLLIFGPWSPLQRDRSGATPPIDPVGTPVVVYAGVAGGFEMSLKITPGPYFLSELLETDLSITNHTHTDYWLLSPNGPNAVCPSLLKIVTTGGGSPYATDIQRYWTGQNILNCTRLLTRTRLPAARTITIKQYVQLTSSGHVTLTAQVAFRKTTNEFGLNDSNAISVGASVPSLHLSVSALVPSDRRLSIKEQGAQVIVYVPPAARGHLLSEIGYACGQGSRVEETGGGPGGENRIGQPTMTLQKPQCQSSIPEKLLWWTFFVGAPGYAMVAGKYP